MATSKQREQKAERRAAHAQRIDKRPEGEPAPSDVRKERKAKLKEQRRAARATREAAADKVAGEKKASRKKRRQEARSAA